MTYPPNIVHAMSRSAPALAESHDEIRETEPSPEYFVKVENTIYGPFTRNLMEQFVEENRVGPQTLISDQAYGAYQPASTTPEFEDWSQAVKTKRYVGRPLPTVYLIIADIQPSKKREFLIVLDQMGRSQKIAESAWVLSTVTDMRFVREALSRNLTEEDHLFIHDSFSNSAGWFNLDEGVDEKITALWKETSQTRKNIKSA